VGYDQDEFRKKSFYCIGKAKLKPAKRK